MKHILHASYAVALLLAPATLHAQDEPKGAPSPNQIVDAALPDEWVKIAPEDLLVMDIAPDRDGNARQVVIQLMPPPFSQGWIGNIRTLAAAHWWDGTSINRVQDNYVVQWGDTSEAKPLPEGLTVMPESEYVAMVSDESGFFAAMDRDHYASGTGFRNGWPLAHGDIAMSNEDEEWPVHCYGMVGVGRNLSPDTGTGAELYTVIGHAPRHLDRNIALVGRVVEGIEHKSSLPRGKGPLGFYEDETRRVPIVSIRLASELAPVEQPRFEYLSTESATFARYADARTNRRDPFFIAPAGGADICNIPVPVRRAKP